VELVPEFAC